MNRQRWRRRGLVALAAVCLGLALVPIVEQDSELVNSDWTVFATGGTLALQEPAHLYDRAAQRRQESRLTGGKVATQKGQGGLLPYVSPPWVALLAAPFTKPGLPLGGRLWVLVELLAMGAGLWLAAGPEDRLRALPAAATVPAGLLVANAQLDGLVVLGLGAAWAAQRKGMEFTAGLALGLTLVKPQLVVPLFAGLLLSRSLRLLAGSTATMVLLLAISYLRDASWPGGWIGAVEQNSGRLGNEIGAPGLAYLVGLPPAAAGLVAAIAVAAVLLLARRAATPGAAAAVLIAGGLLAAPHALATDLVLVAPALLIARVGSWREWVALSAGALVIALSPWWLSPLEGVLLVGGFLLRLTWRPRPPLPARAPG